MKRTVTLAAALTMAWLDMASAPAWADETPAPAAAPAPAPEAPPASPISMPAMAGSTIVANSKPMKVNAGPLGDVYVTGALSVMGMYESNFNAPDEHRFMADATNGQVFVQKVDGPIQFFLEGGAYSLPAVGASYLRAGHATDAEFGGLPVWFLKYAPNDSFSVQAGNLPTLIGAEYAFTFQNVNIERGLIWNQENIVNRGIQGNYTKGPLSLSVAWSDGFFSNRYSWLSGSASYTIDSNNSVTFDAGGSVNTEGPQNNPIATPPLQNNSSIYNVYFSHTSGPFTIIPTLQYTEVPSDAVNQVTQGFLNKSLNTFGGGLYGIYTMDGGYSVAGRVEYINANGSSTDAASLLYGGGSKAWSFTITPTYQNKYFFARAEFSYVKVNSGVNGFMFGPNFQSDSMTRLMVETGFIF